MTGVYSTTMLFTALDFAHSSDPDWDDQPRVTAREAAEIANAKVEPLRAALEDCVRELTHLLNAEPSRRFGKYEAARDAGRAALATLVGEVK